MDNQLDAINEIRSFNRFYTNVLGLLNQHILDSDYSLTEVRVLLEISKTKQCTANTLVNQLEIDRSYMSRIIKCLEKNELITKVQSEHDNRVNFIALTTKGREIIGILGKKSDEQIASLIKYLNPNEVSNVLDAMLIIKNRFSEIINPITIRNFVADDLEYIISRHRILYEEEYGLSSVFGIYVENGVHYMAQHFNSEKDCILIPVINGKAVGSIAIVNADNETAQLRYFLLEPKTRGRGLGHKLVDRALDFCREKKYNHVFLETISFLEVARHIYASKGFKITQSHKNTTWGKDVLEERWDLDL
ncbi:helix-turn-helix domain-containing GNAT family N-acetyltransferase (plasmid) [Clostridium estertheticum]|uniref:bifunctional helix-turn-helix transcriptional regulator/GNAT family N-acetyltransferase n=1 Tax=Clostridium estertheticum TaxID=238834 RepID=UPI001C0E8AC1|nr:helix-turn-helix domain-containing GNAT family N-acetyltransferase [Clostridium estertheticum]MBU3217821.1 helix-turn-helix domain-containing GNAT family N-acetyltransferase [Clostridium estertheticum]WAG58338.1 helix-turn-helix domain-containing GNAT family N-acetyltransferase [Clostridium estertheticum]